jgi:hypothetical protein
MMAGHKDCPHDTETIGTWQGPSWEIEHCRHQHNEEVRADDTLGTGPVVADYCHCCGHMKRRPEYQ